MENPTTWIAMAASFGAAFLATISAGWQLYVGYLNQANERATKINAVEERLQACEDDRADLRKRVEALEAK